MRRKVYLLFLGLLIVFIGIQFVPVDRHNPPVTGEIMAPAEVMNIFQKSCYDCHSNETRWPWYSYIAPVSWRIAGDVAEARENLNFSTWEQLADQEKGYNRAQIVKEVERNKMPLPLYLRLHRQAKLTPDEIATLKTWAKSK